MKKVTLFLPTFLDGGVEKLFLTIAESLNKADYSIEFLLPASVDSRYKETASKFHFSNLGITKSHGDGKVILSLFRLVAYLKTNEIDYIFAAPGYSTIILILATLMARTKAKIILVIDIKLSTFFKSEKIYQRIFPFLAKLLYRKADYIIVSYHQVEKELKKYFNVKATNITTIYPPIVSETIYIKAKEDVDEKWFDDDKYKVIIGVGRLVVEKDFETLIKAFSILNKDDENYKLAILGQGIEEKNLKNLVKVMNLDAHVSFFGFQKNPYKYIQRSSILAVSSKWEAFGFTIVEALALGIQVVITDVDSEGPQEILGLGKYGFISKVGSSEDLARCILNAIKNPIDPKILIKRSKDFDFDKNSRKYSVTLENLYNHTI